MSDLADRQLRPRHLLVGVAAAVAVGALVLVGIGRLAGFSDLRGALEGADYRWLLVCLVGQVVVFTGYAGALGHTVASEGGPVIPRWLALRVVFTSFAATQLFAFGGVGGLAVMYWALRRVGMAADQAAVRLIGLNTAVYLVFGVLGWMAAWWVLVAEDAPLGLTLPWLVGFAVVVLAARWFTAPRRVQRWTHPGVGARGATWVRQGLATGVGAAAWVRRSLARSEGRPLFGWIGLYWIGDVASLWAALRAFGVRPSVGIVLLAYVTGRLVQSLPIPLIATGGVDAATTFLLHALGVPLEVALVAIVAHRLFAFWLPVIPGAVLALLLPGTGRALGEVAGMEPRGRS
jgi:putative heme transporter